MDAARPSLEHDHPVAEQHRLLDRMGDKNHGGRPFIPDAQQLELQNLARLRVDRRERLIHQQHIRFDGERTRQPAALLHAAGHLIGERGFEAAEADQLDELRHLALDLRLRRAGHAQAIGDVVEYGLPRKQAEMLEHHGDAGDRLFDALVADPDFAGIVRQQAVDAAQQRGLAATGRPDYGDDLAFGHVEIDIAEHFERAVTLGQPLDANTGLACGTLRSGWANGGYRRWLIYHSAACVEGLALILAQ